MGRSRVAVSNLVRLLDLPDEAIELLQRGALSEGHGRALLLAEDHAARRSLARAAVEEGWSVRVTEERAREGNGQRAGAHAAARGRGRCTPTRSRPRGRSPQALGGALGAEVQVRPARDGGYSAQLSFSPRRGGDRAGRSAISAPARSW